MVAPVAPPNNFGLLQELHKISPSLAWIQVTLDSL